MPRPRNDGTYAWKNARARLAVIDELLKDHDALAAERNALQVWLDQAVVLANGTPSPDAAKPQPLGGGGTAGEVLDETSPADELPVDPLQAGEGQGGDDHGKKAAADPGRPHPDDPFTIQQELRGGAASEPDPETMADHPGRSDPEQTAASDIESHAAEGQLQERQASPEATREKAAE